MWKKKLKQKKHQFLLIGIVLVFTTAIFAGCISFTLETSKFGNNFYHSDKCPDMVYLTHGENTADLLLQNPEFTSNTKDTLSLPARYISSPMYYNNEAISNTYPTCVGLESIQQIPYYFELAQGNTKESCPDSNSIWLSQAFADDNDIQVGDSVTFRGNTNMTLRVSALYNSSVIPSGMMGIFPMYVNLDTLSQMNEEVASYITVFYQDGIKTLSKDAVSDEFMSNLYYSLDRDGVIMTYSTASTLFGGIGSMAALIVFVVSIILIRFLLRSTLMKEFRSIGIYKSLGYTSKQIIRFYLNCYSFVGVIAVPLGIVLGIPLASLLGTITNQYLGGYHITYVTLLTGIATFLVLMIILIANVYRTLQRIPSITPVKALTIGQTSTKAKLKRSLIPHAHSPFSMAINQIAKKKGMSLMVVLVLTVSFYLTLLFSSINYTCSQLSSHTDIWFGLPKNDCIASYDVDDTLRTYLSNSPYVKKVAYGDFSVRSLTYKSNETGEDLSTYPIFAYESFDSSCADFNYMEGRPPVNPLEIAITKDLIPLIGGSVGDYVNLTIGNYTGDFLITGIASSLMQGGYNMHIQASDLDRCGLSYSLDVSVVQLVNDTCFDEFQQVTAKQFPNLQFNRIMPGLQSAILSIESLSKPLTTTLVIVFILFSLLNIINLMMMNNLDQRKQYGILKSLGFTNRYICAQNLFRIGLLSTIAAIFAQVIDLVVSKKLFISLVGLNALTCPLPLRLGVTVGIIVLILVVTYAFTLPLRHITPTELMEE